MSLAAGSKLGPYEVLAMIGKGGMGEVYRAHDPRTGRDVAIKVSAERFSERFDREVRAVAALNHLNICTLYNVGPNYLVMELVEGESLDALIKSGPLPLATAMNYARQIAAALEEAHEKGVVHRDLKPGNIKIKPDGTVKVLDFGLAKQNRDSDGAVSENSPTISMAMTQAGVILGTAAYMAPEQARGKKVDRRADIWAFGVVLYEMLTGKRLFEGEDLTETLAAVVMKEPDLSGVPVEARRLLKKCLEKDPRKRLQAIGDMGLVLDVGQVSDLPAQAGGLRHAAWVVAGLATLALAALAFVHFREQPAERQVLQYTLAAPEKARNIQYFAVSPDGHYLVIQASGEGGYQLWLRAFDSLQTQPLAGTEDANYPFWSPDSRYIAFFAQNKLKKISVNGGPAQTLCDAINSRGGAWNRDNVIVFAPLNGNGGLSRVPAAGGVTLPVTKTGGAGSHRWPVFLPDGRRFLYLVTNGGKETGIHLASLDAKPDSKEDRPLILDESNPEYLAPSPGNPLGHLLFVREQALMAQPVDPQTLEPKGELFPVADQVSRGSATGISLYSVSESGILIVQTGAGAGTQHLWFDRTGKELGPVRGVVQSRPTFALSPDGKRVVIERPAASQSNTDLWITDLEHSGTETRLTIDASINTRPVWSPDGSKVAFSSTRGGFVNLYQRASNNTGEDELLFNSKEVKYATDWSRDGRFIIFQKQDPKTAEDLWALPVAGGPGERKPIPLLQSEFRETQGQLSPDGRWLAYTSNESGGSQVVVVPFAPGWEKPMIGKWQISLAGGTQPRWRGDSKELFYMAPDRKLMAVEVKAAAQSFDRSTPQALFESRSSLGPTAANNLGYVPSADGQRFLIGVAPGGAAVAPPLTVVVNWLAGVKK